jgi:hypothetical protein
MFNTQPLSSTYRLATKVAYDEGGMLQARLSQFLTHSLLNDIKHSCGWSYNQAFLFSTCDFDLNHCFDGRSETKNVKISAKSICLTTHMLDSEDR